MGEGELPADEQEALARVIAEDIGHVLGADEHSAGLHLK